MKIVFFLSCVLLCFSAVSCHSQRKSSNVIVANECRNLMIIIKEFETGNKELPRDLGGLNKVYNQRLSSDVDLSSWAYVETHDSYVLFHKKVIDGKLIVGIPPGGIKLIEME